MIIGEIYKKNDRSGVFDIVKGISVIALVAYHSHNYYPSMIISKFFMAAFVFCSGYFIRPNRSLSEIAIKRIKKLYIPYVLMCTLFLLLHNAFSAIGITSGAKGTRELIGDFLKILVLHNRENLLVQIWFVTLLVLAEAIYIFLYKISYLIFRNALVSDAVCVVFGVAIYIFNAIYSDGFVSTFWYSQCTIVGCVCTTFIVIPLANILREKKYSINITPRNTVMFTLGVLALTFMSTKISDYRIDIRQNIISHKWIYLINCIIGIWCLFYFSKLLSQISSKYVPNFLAFLGANSLWILFFHVLVFKFLSLIQLRLFNISYEGNLTNWGFVYTAGVWGYIYVASGIIIPCTIKILVDRALYRLKTKKLNNA